jgi:hypothetical protein
VGKTAEHGPPRRGRHFVSLRVRHSCGHHLCGPALRLDGLLVTSAALFGISMPFFWLGLMLLVIFSDSHLSLSRLWDSP